MSLSHGKVSGVVVYLYIIYISIYVYQYSKCPLPWNHETEHSPPTTMKFNFVTSNVCRTIHFQNTRNISLFDIQNAFIYINNMSILHSSSSTMYDGNEVGLPFVMAAVDADVVDGDVMIVVPVLNVHQTDTLVETR